MAGPELLPRIQKVFDATPPQTGEWFVLDGIVKNLKRRSETDLSNKPGVVVIR